MRERGNHRSPRAGNRDRTDSQRPQDWRLRRACLLARRLQFDRLDRRRSPKGGGPLSCKMNCSMLRWVDIDEQVMNEAILSPHPSHPRRSRPEESGADSEYADVVA